LATSADHAEAGSAASRVALVPCVLAWLLPGAGHFYLGRRLRGISFLAIVLITYVLGLSLDGRAYIADRLHPLTYLATFANIGLGPLDILERRATYGELVWRLPQGPAGEVLLDRMRDRVRSGRSEYGTTFLLTAGLMNLLLILDAFDVATGRKAPPKEAES
jgi:TM2 domain-containing membrane protein YozV